jgi:hypothetical protein
MNVVDTTRPFSWSYSKLHDFEICPRRYDLKKNYPEARNENLSWGDAVHAAMADALRTGKPLALAYAQYQHWIDKVVRTPGELLVETECKWAVTRDLKATVWGSKTAWLRSVADAVKVDLSYPEAAYVVDWKTGKSQNADELQLILIALVCFIQFPQLLRVRADFIWLTEDSKTSKVIDKHEVKDYWAEIIPRVDRLVKAIETDNFPPLPNNFCARYCPVRACEYWGK